MSETEAYMHRLEVEGREEKWVVLVLPIFAMAQRLLTSKTEVEDNQTQMYHQIRNSILSL